MLPGKPGWAVANYFRHYDGRAGAIHSLPIGGQVALDLGDRAYADTVVVFCETSAKLLGGEYAVALGIRFVRVDVDAQVIGPAGRAFQTHDSASGLGDIARVDEE